MPEESLIPKADFRIYDAPPDTDPENYQLGYVIIYKVKSSPVQIIGLMEHIEKTNPIAVIPTEYFSNIEDDTPSGFVYVIYNTEFEYKYGVRCTKGVRFAVSRMAHELIPGDKMVYYHKAWILHSYDPTRFDTEEKKYDVIKGDVKFQKMLGKRAVNKIKIAHFKISNADCYIPTSRSNMTCTMEKHKNYNLCVECALSRYRYRYESRDGMMRVKPSRRKNGKVIQ